MALRHPILRIIQMLFCGSVERFLSQFPILQFMKVTGYTLLFIGKIIGCQTIHFQRIKELLGKTFHLFQNLFFQSIEYLPIVLDAILIL